MRSLLTPGPPRLLGQSPGVASLDQLDRPRREALAGSAFLVDPTGHGVLLPVRAACPPARVGQAAVGTSRCRPPMATRAARTDRPMNEAWRACPLIPDQVCARRPRMSISFVRRTYRGLDRLSEHACRSRRLARSTGTRASAGRRLVRARLGARLRFASRSLLNPVGTGEGAEIGVVWGTEEALERSLMPRFALLKEANTLPPLSLATTMVRSGVVRPGPPASLRRRAAKLCRPISAYAGPSCASAAPIAVDTTPSIPATPRVRQDLMSGRGTAASRKVPHRLDGRRQGVTQREYRCDISSYRIDRPPCDAGSVIVSASNARSSARVAAASARAQRTPNAGSRPNSEQSADLGNRCGSVCTTTGGACCLPARRWGQRRYREYPHPRGRECRCTERAMSAAPGRTTCVGSRPGSAPDTAALRSQAPVRRLRGHSGAEARRPRDTVWDDAVPAVASQYQRRLRGVDHQFGQRDSAAPTSVQQAAPGLQGNASPHRRGYERLRGKGT